MGQKCLGGRRGHRGLVHSGQLRGRGQSGPRRQGAGPQRNLHHPRPLLRRPGPPGPGIHALGAGRAQGEYLFRLAAAPGLSPTGRVIFTTFILSISASGSIQKRIATQCHAMLDQMIADLPCFAE